jgi:hypothetical protein
MGDSLLREEPGAEKEIQGSTPGTFSISNVCSVYKTALT